MSGPDVKTRRQVIARDLSRCQWCGRYVRTESGWYSLQHRRARGMGGTSRASSNDPANLLLVCGTGTTECHGWIEAHPQEAEARGFRMNSGAEPSRVPYIDAAGKKWQLDAAGTRRQLSTHAAPCPPYRGKSHCPDCSPLPASQLEDLLDALTRSTTRRKK